MNFIDLFSGVGGFTRGLELAGHECVGHCELDKFAEASYRSMHTITDEQRKYLLSLPLKQRQKEILKEEYLNGEWYESDIKRARNIPRADIWTFGAPCQDFSIAGRRAGLDGERSSLVREVFRLIAERQEKDRPEWLIYENVKGMLSSSSGRDFLEILYTMDGLGYDAEWQVINSKWFVPQNRERVYLIGHLRARGRKQILPIEGADGKNCLCQLIGGRQGERVYDPKGISCTLSALGGGQGAKTGLYAFGIDKSQDHPKKIDIANCITGNENRGVAKVRSQGTAIAIPVLTPDRVKKRENGRRFKECGEPMFTLTAQDRHGVAIDLKTFSSSTRGQPFRYGHTACLNHNCYQGVVVEVKDGGTVYAVWSEKYGCYLAIRKLTPKESFRLQGWTDEYFEKAKQFNSDSQLYKQAGNGVTVDVVKAIGEKLKEQEND